MNPFTYFTFEEFNLLIRLVLAHLLSDFVFQTKGMVNDKRWNSFGLLSHIAVTIVAVLALTGNIAIAFFIGITHYFIDLGKTFLTNKYPDQKVRWFLLDQFAHLLVIVFIWAASLGKIGAMISICNFIITDFKITLILLGYFFCIWPTSYIVGMAVQSLLQTDTTSPLETERIEHGGRWIGQFERVIIFTFVLLNQYEAIGFLITGKSIIRFADRDHIKSEYVLAGTMLSYALAIGSGAFINWILS
jgi:hypothetical protein